MAPKTRLLLSVVVFLTTASACAGEIYFVNEDAQSMTVIAVETVKPFTEKESLVPFRMLTAQKKTRPNDPRIVSRHLLVALCEAGTKRLGGGQLLTMTASSSHYETLGEPDKVLTNDRFNPPKAVGRKFTLAYEAAEIACANAEYQ